MIGLARVGSKKPTWARYYEPEALAKEAEVLPTRKDRLDSEAVLEQIRKQADYVPLDLDGRVKIQEQREA